MNRHIRIGMMLILILMNLDDLRDPDPMWMQVWSWVLVASAAMLIGWDVWKLRQGDGEVRSDA